MKSAIGLIIVYMAISVGFAQVPNGSFENWTNNAPDGWETNNTVQLFAGEQSADAYEGSSALRLQVTDIGSSPLGMSPLVFAGTYSDYGFDISEKYTIFGGYYKYTPVEGDILDITVTFNVGNQLIGQYELSTTTEVSEYTYFGGTVTYYSEGTPDNCQIFLTIKNSDNTQMPHLGSYAIIDDLNLSTVTTGIKENDLPGSFKLAQNYPNPFNPSTTIEYSLPKSSNIKLSVYDVLGNEIKILESGYKKQGNYKVLFDAENLSSGVYFYQLKYGAESINRKMLILK